MKFRIALLAFMLPTGSAGVLLAEDGRWPLPELADRLESVQPAGCAEYGFLFFRWYRAELWTDAPDRPGDRFGLSLVYHRDFSRSDLVSASIAEMVRMSGRPESSFPPARAQLERVMRAVGKGDRFTAWRGGPERLEFFFNGEDAGVLTQDADLFLDIWLGAGSRDRRGRTALLSRSCDD